MALKSLVFRCGAVRLCPPSPPTEVFRANDSAKHKTSHTDTHTHTQRVFSKPQRLSIATAIATAKERSSLSLFQCLYFVFLPKFCCCSSSSNSVKIIWNPPTAWLSLTDNKISLQVHTNTPALLSVCIILGSYYLISRDLDRDHKKKLFFCSSGAYITRTALYEEG